MNSTLLSFWEGNGSIMLPGDINLRWKDYREIVQPDKASFWVMLGSLLLFIIWIVFITYYMSRVVGPIVAFLLTRLAHLKGYDVEISVGSFSISLLAGKIMFRDFRCMSQNFLFCCNDGWVVFSYWNYIPVAHVYKSNISRLHISLNGLQLHVYNRLSKYRTLARFFGLEKLFASVKEEVDINKERRYTYVSAEEELEWHKSCDNLWSLIGYIRFDVSSGRLIAGNALLPSMVVCSFENYASEISLKEYGKGEDIALLSIVGSTENVRISLVQCNHFTKKKPLNFNGRCDQPPRTMGGGFAIVQTAHLNFFYSQSIPGFVKKGQQSATENLPVWESVWRFDKNTIFSYGPWADAQRVQLYEFFFPPEYRDSEVTIMPKEGERRILLSHDMRISLWNDAVIDIWFMREDELNALHLRVKQGSSLDLKMPWVTTEKGFETVLRCCFLFVESSTSLAYPKFFQCETFRLTLNVFYPRVFNGHQLWKYAVKINKGRLWIVWDHKRFFADLMNEWVSDSIVDLFKFIPYTWEFEVNAMDNFEITLLLNDHNWIDVSTSLSAENHLAAIIGKNMTVSFALHVLEFCPRTITTLYEVSAYHGLALRAWLPSESPFYSVVHSLLKYASSQTKNSSAELQDWVELWRTEKISLLFEYTHHPLYSDQPSDLPLNNTKTAAKEHSTPMTLSPDQLLIEIDISNSDIVLVGLIIRLIIDLKNNYFGLNDELTDVGRCKSGSTSSPLYGNVIWDECERYRPLSLRLCLRVGKIRGLCLVQNLSVNSSTSEFKVLLFFSHIF
ncbi:unnamed protein product [Thelazia callipaeda]|uniref:FSA_C domain-containing protein n=1 Tax=Thelazia callipaeda TaxID=103827 RepID=A0A0N5CQ23_THECL|nr:unnamed protein product [Thelazia callipaeda]